MSQETIQELSYGCVIGDRFGRSKYHSRPGLQHYLVIFA